MRRLTVVLGCVVLSAAGGLARAADDDTVAVGIFSGRRITACTIESQNALHVEAGAAASGEDLPPGVAVTLTAADGVVRLQRADAEAAVAGSTCVLSSGTPLLIRPAGLAPRSYRGAVAASERGGLLVLVNRVGLEDYLRGVVPAEMPAGFAPEALKAQVIAARTYTLANRAKHGKEGFGLCDGVHCQVYQGASGEDRRIDAAVQETAGLVLTYQGLPIRAVYHDTCGGQTAASTEAWATRTRTPYLCPVDDTYAVAPLCQASPKARWQRSLSQGKLASALAKYGVTAPVTALRPVGCEDGTRPDGYRLTGPGGEWTVPAGRLREAVTAACGADALPSANFVAGIAGDTISFTGWGNGHGVGLCQWGANALAKQGRTANEILAHYYPGAQMGQHPGTQVEHLAE